MNYLVVSIAINLNEWTLLNVQIVTSQIKWNITNVPYYVREINKSFLSIYILDLVKLFKHVQYYVHIYSIQI